jgi:GNAT superfamily N-acetyltransferase
MRIDAAPDVRRSRVDEVARAASHIALMTAEPHDGAAIDRFMRELSRESRRSRFFVSMDDSALAAEMVRELRPAANTVSVVARDRASGLIVGHAIAIGDERGVSEVALAVADAYHNHGIGTLLLERVMAQAALRGARAFEAEILPDNRSMLDIFARAGYELIRRPGDNAVHAQALSTPPPRARAASG